MTDRTVQQGETTCSIAIEEGFAPDRIWNDSKNADLKATREMNVLFGGGAGYKSDIMFIPVINSTQFECAPGSTPNVFVNMARYAIFKFCVMYNDAPLKNIAYIFSYEIGGQETKIPGTTDDNGFLTHRIPANATTGKVVIKQSEDEQYFDPIDLEIPLSFGALDPLRVAEDSGDVVNFLKAALQRLAALGYYDGEIVDEPTDETKTAIKRFKDFYGMKIDDVDDQEIGFNLDDETLKKLLEVFGS